MKDNTLLVVEDDIVINELYVTIFGRLFKEVVVAYNGREAIEKLEKYQIDVVLTDINMPDGTGQDVVEYVAKQEVKRPIVIITAHDKLRKMYDESECVVVHRKPADLQVIIKDLERLLDKRHACTNTKVYEKLEQLTKKVDAFLDLLHSKEV